MKRKLLLLMFSACMAVSCTKSKKDILTKKWKVVQMQRNSRDIEISNNMSYDFKDDNYVTVITQNSSEIIGKWAVKNDSLFIAVKEETKGFIIAELKENKATLKSGEFTFELEN